MNNSARESMLGYTYQIKYALVEALKRLRTSEPFYLFIENLDDVSIRSKSNKIDVYQLKHHNESIPDLSNSSPDLWKTFKIWLRLLTNESQISIGCFFLVTTSKVNENSAPFFLKAGSNRDIRKASTLLTATAQTSSNKTNQDGYLAFLALTDSDRDDFLNRVWVVDNNLSISEIEEDLRKELYFVVPRDEMKSFTIRLEGWWLDKVIKQMHIDPDTPIISDEIDNEVNRLREQFSSENLPIDDDIMLTDVDGGSYEERVFIHQLKIIGIENPKRVLFAIKDYYRAFSQRTRWINERLLHINELDRYEDKLVDIWDRKFQQMKDKLGNQASEQIMKEAAVSLYEWIESGELPPIRKKVDEAIIARGSYHILSERQVVGWHPKFKQRIKEVLDRIGE